MLECMHVFLARKKSRPAWLPETHGRLKQSYQHIRQTCMHHNPMPTDTDGRSTSCRTPTGCTARVAQQGFQRSQNVLAGDATDSTGLQDCCIAVCAGYRNP